MQKSYKLHIENYTTVQELDLDLSPGVQGFVGKNAQGKSNILKAIQELLDGRNDPSKIRDGEEKYVIRLNVFNGEGVLEATIARIQTKTGSRLDAKGLPVGFTAASYLARLFDSQMLNPVRLLTESPVDYLKKHLPAKVFEEDLPDDFKAMKIDDVPMANGFDYCAGVASQIGAIRLVEGKRVKEMEGVLNDLRAGLPAKRPEAPYQEEQVQQTIADLNRSMTEIEFKADKKAEANVKIGDLNRKIAALSNEIEGLRKRAAELISEADSKSLYREELAKQWKEETIRAEQIVVPNAGDLHAKIRGERDKLSMISSWKDVMARFDKLDQREKEFEELKARHERLDGLFKYFKYELPKTLIGRANLPVEGLEFRDNELFVNDRRADLLSETERAIVATRIAAALARQRGHLAISLDGIEIMDEAHRKQWLDVAKESGLKVFYTRQGTPDGDHEFEVVDGQVH